MAFALQARVVFPIDRPAIERGVVTIDGQRIVAIGTTGEAGEVTDLGSVALLPGLVNCHSHLEFSHLRRPLGKPGMRLVDWIRLVIAERGQTDAVAASIRDGLRESLLHGATTVGEVASAKADAYIDVYDSLVLFAEVIGFSRVRADSALVALCEELDALKRNSRAELGISPHAPYTVSPQLLARLISLANERVLPVTMHVAEGAEELELLRSGTGPFQELLDERSMWDAEAIPRGSRPLDYLRLLAEAPRALVIHGNYLDEEEKSFLAAHSDRMSLVHCPRTHNYFQHPPFPLPDLLAAGVRVALGTDSLASNPDLDLLAEMRCVAQKFPAIDPHDILRMGTMAGAEALGRAADVGGITPGKLANLVAVPLPDEARGSADYWLGGLLAASDAPREVWLRGMRMS